MDSMTRPQLYIWLETTAKRESDEKLAEEKAKWSHTANIVAMIHNTTFGMKEKDRKEVQEFIPDFDEIEIENNELIEEAKKKGIKTPSSY